MLKKQNFQFLNNSFFAYHFSFVTQVFLNVFKKRYYSFVLLWAGLTFLYCLSHYIAYTDSFLILSLILPLVLSGFSIFLVALFSLFVLPYWTQTELNNQNFCQRPLSAWVSKFSTWVRKMVQVMAVSYLWGLLLIVPGVWKFLKCSFVSYVTLLGERESSPLKTSYQYTKGHMKHISFLFFAYVSVLVVLNFSFPNLHYLNGLMATQFLLKSFWHLFASSFISMSFHLIYLEEEEKRKPPAPSVSQELSI